MCQWPIEVDDECAFIRSLRVNQHILVVCYYSNLVCTAAVLQVLCILR